MERKDLTWNQYRHCSIWTSLTNQPVFLHWEQFQKLSYQAMAEVDWKHFFHTVREAVKIEKIEKKIITMWNFTLLGRGSKPKVFKFLPFFYFFYFEGFPYSGGGNMMWWNLIIQDRIGIVKWRLFLSRIKGKYRLNKINFHWKLKYVSS